MTLMENYKQDKMKLINNKQFERNKLRNFFMSPFKSEETRPFASKPERIQSISLDMQDHSQDQNVEITALKLEALPGYSKSSERTLSQYSSIGSRDVPINDGINQAMYSPISTGSNESSGERAWGAGANSGINVSPNGSTMSDSHYQLLTSYGDSNRHPYVMQDENGDAGDGRNRNNVTNNTSSCLSADDHCHLPKPSSQGSRRAITKLLIACCLSTLFMVGEVIGGYIANSIAIMSDAAHMFSDLTSFIVSLVAIYLAMRPASRKMNYGYHRAEVLGAVISVLMIWVITGLLVYAAIERCISMDFEVDGDAMIIVSAVGVVMNIILGIVLHSGQGGHGHSHGGIGHSHGSISHSHGGMSHNHSSEGDNCDTRVPRINQPLSDTSTEVVSVAVDDDALSNNITRDGGTTDGAAAVHQNKPETNVNIRAAFIHVLGDLLQSIGVLIAAYIIRFHPEYKIADPICTFIFSVIVLVTTIPILRDLGRVLMEAVPPGVDYNSICAHLAALPGVKMVHSLHVWAITVDKNACSVHLAVDTECDSDAVLKAAQRVIRTRHFIYHTTIQVEKYSPMLMDNCIQCQPLP